MCNRRASMHPASDVRYFVIMSRAMFIAILNGRRGGDLARISRDTRLLRCAFRNTPGKKHYCLFSRSFFFSFFFFRYVGEFFKKRPATGSFWKLDSDVERLIYVVTFAAIDKRYTCSNCNVAFHRKFYRTKDHFTKRQIILNLYL